MNKGRGLFTSWACPLDGGEGVPGLAEGGAPDPDTVYWSFELGPITLGSMLNGIDPGLFPADEAALSDLRRALDAWETLGDMLETVACACAACAPSPMAKLVYGVAGESVRR